jgi:integrase
MRPSCGPWKGVRRERGTKPRSQKQPVSKERLLSAVTAIRVAYARAMATAEAAKDVRAARAQALQQLRDDTLLLLGWSGALRRSELVEIDFAHLRLEDKGLHIDLASSKTNQEGEAEFVLVHAIRRSVRRARCVLGSTPWPRSARRSRTGLPAD